MPINLYPLRLLFQTFVSGALIFLLVAGWLHLPLPEKRFRLWIALTGVLQIFLNNIIVQICITPLGSGLSAVLNYTMPLWTALLAWPFLGEHLTIQKMAGILLSIAGLVILLQVDLQANLLFLPLALSGAFLWAVSNIIYKRKLVDCNPIVYNTWQMAVGAAVLVVLMIATQQPVGTFTPLSVGFILYNGILASALAFFLWSYVLSHMDAGKASVSILAVPVVGVLCGVVFLDETMTFTKGIGMLMILLGILAVLAPAKQKKWLNHFFCGMNDAQRVNGDSCR